jgi:hypothetical protein
MIKKLLLPFFLVLSSVTVLSQSLGDYRSSVTSEVWTALSSWQYYNGSSWVTPSGTSPQGYPGQFTGTKTVTIRDGHTITTSGSTPSTFGGLVIGEGTSGILVIAADVNILTTNVIINATAQIKFSGNNEVRFPANTGIKIYSPGIIDNQGTCNNNVAVYIGTVKYAVCKGAGNAEFSFDEVNSSGGTLLALPTSTAVACQNSTINLFGNFSGTVGTMISNGTTTGVSYSWAIKDPNNNVTSSSAQNPSLAANLTGTYQATLTCSTYSGSTIYTNSNTISITVNPLPVIVTQLMNQLDCEGSMVNFKIVMSGAGPFTYTWQRKRPSDAFFTSIPIEANVEYPVAGEIKLINVGSSLSPNGTQFQVIVSNGTCSITSNPATLSVNEITNMNSPSLTPSQSVVDVTLCYGANYSYTATISNPSNGPVSYQWKSSTVSGTWNNVIDGTHFSGAASPTLNIINGTPTESARYRVDVVYNRTGGNCSVSSFATVRELTFLPLLLTPDTETIQPNCTLATGTITVKVQSVTDTYSFDNGANYQPNNVKSGLVPGDYKVIIKNKGNCLSVIKSCNITGSFEKTWNGSSWLPSSPTSSDKIVFNGSYSSTGDLLGCACQINSGSVTFNSGHTLFLANELVIQGGSVTFENHSSLVQINDVSNSGMVTYRRVISGVTNNDYTYWSSPVENQTLLNVSPNTISSNFYSFDPVADDWKRESTAAIMSKGIGYIISGPEFFAPNPPGVHIASFRGNPHNGTVNIPINTTIESSYLLGNPYPSALDADSFIVANNTVLDGTLYFWTHNTAIQLRDNIAPGTAGSGAYAYTSNDYASYNITGGVKANSGGDMPLGKIGSGQGFFVTSISAGTVLFNNNMRVGVGSITGNNSQFFKTVSNSKTGSEIEKHRLWLNLTNSQGAFKQTLIGYIKGATNGYDNAYDGESFDGNEFVDFYTVNEDKNLVIQGRALPFEETDTINLGYSSTIEGSFFIDIDQVDGLLMDQEIFLEDKKLAIIHDLKKAAYNFSTNKGVFNDRFVLRYTNNTLNTGDFEMLDNQIIVSSKHKRITINSSAGAVQKIEVYDLLGRQLYEKGDINDSSFKIQNLMVGQPILLVKVMLKNGQIVSKKIIY